MLPREKAIKSLFFLLQLWPPVTKSVLTCWTQLIVDYFESHSSENFYELQARDIEEIMWREGEQWQTI